MVVEQDICPKCRFPKRISGHIFLRKSTRDLEVIERNRCPFCRHVMDYEIISINPLQAKIIYRNFTGSEEYFNKIKSWLKVQGAEVV